MASKVTRTKERNALRVIKGGYAPADASTAARLREKGHRVGNLVFAEFKRARNPKFFRKMHYFGRMLSENLEPFTGMDYHDVLKRIQIEGNIGCDEIGIIFPGIGPCTYRIPRSLSFENMDDDEFTEIYRSMCTHISKTYWKSCTAEEIERMADSWVDTP